MTKILLVEDDEILGSTLTERLSEEGYTVTWARTQNDAQSAFESWKMDLVILDVGLPDGSGFSLGRIVKDGRNVPLVFLTAMVSAESRLQQDK